MPERLGAFSVAAIKQLSRKSTESVKQRKWSALRFLGVRPKSSELNTPEEFVFPHIAALFLSRHTSVWLRQRSTTLHEKTSPSGAKQFLKSKFLLRQGKQASNADALRGFGAQYRRKFAFKNRIEFKSLQPT